MNWLWLVIAALLVVLFVVARHFRKCLKEHRQKYTELQRASMVGILGLAAKNIETGIALLPPGTTVSMVRGPDSLILTGSTSERQLVRYRFQIEDSFIRVYSLTGPPDVHTFAFFRADEACGLFWRLGGLRDTEGKQL